jgi:glyoxylase-like metal-dependent hydrolase (beta-lactamase superfamily II)
MRNFFTRWAVSGGPAAAFLLITLSGLQAADPTAASGDLETVHVRPNIYVIFGAGANVTVQTGEDGVIVIDPGSAAKSDAVLAAIKRVTDQPIRYVIDTGADADHVGGNEAIARAGQWFGGAAPQATPGAPAGGGAPAAIMATEHVADRMGGDEGNRKAYPVAAWPTDAFSERKKLLHMSGEGIEVIAEPGAHSDGDLAVLFRGSDVIAAGEIVDMTRFPVIDLARGGSIQGELDGLNRLMDITIPDLPLAWKGGGTIVVPAHGRLIRKDELTRYRDMVTIIRDVVASEIAGGMTLEQVLEAQPAKGYAPRYSTDPSWTTNMFVEAIYKSLKNEVKK